MPGPPIRKPSDHSPPAGSPRNIAGHHVLHRPLMPRHPPNAHKNKQHNTRQNTCRRLTVRCSRPLYSSQPTHPHPPKTPKNGNPGRVRQPGRTAPEPRQHATPNKGGHPPTSRPPRPQQPQQPTTRRACLLCQHQATNPTPAPTTQARHQSTSQPPCFPRAATPRPARTHQRPRQDQTTRKPPPHNLSLERR